MYRPWASLRMALYAHVARSDVVAVGWIKNVCADGMRHMFAAGTMAAFTAHVPLGNLLGVDVVTDRMAPITQWPRRSLHIVWRVEGHPPIRPLADKIFAPFVIPDFPLNRQGEIVVPDF